MANVQRYRSGEQEVVSGVIQAGVLAEIGDLVALVSDYVVPASTFSASGASGTDVAQEAFHDAFLGVLIEGATTGSETVNSPCLVATTGDFDYDVAALAAIKSAGTLFGAFDDGAVLADQQLVEADATDEAICKLSRNALVGDTVIRVRIKSTIMDGGYQTPE